jgi:hypothetical protein
MSVSFSWRHEPIAQGFQQQRGSQLVPPGEAPGDIVRVKPPEAAKAGADPKIAPAEPAALSLAIPARAA